MFGVEERPVPKGDVPTEWYSPTQPIPVKPRPLSRVSFKKADMVTAADTTPEHAAACQAMWDEAGGYRNDGPFTPFYYHEDGTPPKRLPIVSTGMWKSCTAAVATTIATNGAGIL